MNTPLHSRSKHFLQQGLFTGICNFAELERRIEALSDERQRGDAFEVFSEAYLATQRAHEADKLWPQSTAPIDVLQSLGLTVKDNGVDGLLRSPVGLVSVYQSKFRSGRASLTWRDLSTFMGLADSSQIHSRMLITNSDDIPTLMNDRRNFSCIRGADFERLEEGDFDAIERWLAGAPVDIPKKDPRPHQQEAITAILPALEQHGRATAVMACGTGKTLVALWVAERSQAKRILVLLPSLSLVRQTLHEWLHETRWPTLAYLCVCSDPTVTSEIDSLSVQQSDLDFQVNTDSETVRAFLDADFDGTRLVFCTYQSAHIVGAAMRDGEAFDLGIFDEAHKTAGRVGIRFAFALNDQNLAIRKRLFLTATPRHFNFRKKNEEGDAKLVYSMDVPEIYGPIAFKMTFAEAARRQIICPYKVAISVVTSDMVTSERLRRGEVIINGDAVRAIQVANQIALQKAVAEYGVTKVFTFHRTVKSAKSFTSSDSEGIATHLPDFARMHVNGDMSTAVRDSLMRSFSEAPKAIMSNARCLTEGVDVPAVDMVAFLTPKRSLIEIVQATGRAMRRSANKEYGYVLVPLYLEHHEGESIEEALGRTRFKEVWNVLGAMLEQDELFAQVISQLREDRGSRRGFDDSAFRERVEVIGDEISLDTVQKHVTVMSMKRFGSSWDEWYGQLKAFQTANGHCNVGWRDSANESLRTWTGNQRQLRKRDQLSADRIRRLDILGFDWGSEVDADEMWACRRQELADYKARYGDCNVSAKWGYNPSLGVWVNNTRALRKKGKLAEDRIESLDQLGFAWGLRNRSVRRLDWNEMVQQYVDQQKNQSKSKPSVKAFPILMNWVGRVRQDKANGLLPDEQIKAMEAIGFDWSTAKDRSDSIYAALVDYQKIHGDCNVPEEWPENQKLANWVKSQRQSCRSGKINPELRQRLESIGFTLSQAKTATWEEMFASLVEFKRQHGHCKVPRLYSESPGLGRWVNTQRFTKKNGQLDASKVERLESIVFIWNAISDTWEKMFTELKQYKATHGHFNVQTNDPEFRTLGYWVKNQRSGWIEIQNGKTKPRSQTLVQIKRLQDLGFDFGSASSQEDRCEENFAALQSYKTKYGDCNVPAKSEEHSQLATWMKTQRTQLKAGKLSEQCRLRLTEIGIIWDLHEHSWQRMYEAMKDFKHQNGHCWVPSAWPVNPRLGAWVSAQRTAKEAGTLSEARISLLAAIGFVWGRSDSQSTEVGSRGSLQDQKWQKMFNELAKYKQQFGNCNIPAVWPENPRFASWVKTQRAAKKSGEMPPYRVQLLDDMGFNWDRSNSPPTEVALRGSLHGQKWQQMFDELAKYKQQFGNCNIPAVLPDNPRLASWVTTQRAAKMSGKMPPFRVQLLDDLGFNWGKDDSQDAEVGFVGSLHDQKWQQMYNELAQYKQQFGNRNMQTVWLDNPPLARWVNSQRTAKKSGKMPQYRVQLLDDMGFIWERHSKDQWWREVAEDS